jgi:triose/dihydroxyacetone kinase / FAD-AMP lyase (cyclizing)
MSSYMTSLNAPGFSVSLLNVSAAERELLFYPNILQLIDDPTEAVSWVGARMPANKQAINISENNVAFKTQKMPSSLSDPVMFWRENDVSCEAVRRGIVGACNAVLQAEKELTQYDSIVGDGDCGATFATGARGQWSSSLFGTLELIPVARSCPGAGRVPSIRCVPAQPFGLSQPTGRYTRR